ncbi:SdpI family protein [Subdoligranulum variabile]|uniref:DUF1648 domain-containing protein n=1 Tax=Subdoligranulum variabile DSM 15176 TaxID=411471 RepID=D1PLL4_9FIRM|nr:SdpI family protein [Subdoligranulum variabile]EFB76312.1 hypothetical protein SUBVAR_05229 [Subdoligranulum variabile DSM 15176]UWP67940.1 SdpI family protein [Subdoligranulum variabile]
MKNKKLYLLLAAVCVLNFAAHLYFYPSLPDIVPTHWGFDGQANGWGPKSSTLFICIIPLALLILLAVIPKIDPRAQNYEKFEKIYRGFVIGIIVFMCGITWLTELTVYNVLPGSSNLVSVLVCGGLGVLFIALGNYMPRIKQNYTFGCKTPWALNDEHNWNRTQRMGGIVFVVIGIAMLVATLFTHALGETGTMIVVLGSTLGGTAWIYLYSYLVYIGKMK